MTRRLILSVHATGKWGAYFNQRSIRQRKRGRYSEVKVGVTGECYLMPEAMLGAYAGSNARRICTGLMQKRTEEKRILTENLLSLFR